LHLHTNIFTGEDMTKDEALRLALEALQNPWKAGPNGVADAIIAIKEALAQPEPVKIAHKHEWFRTGEMKVGQMRCISCGTWGQEEMPKRTWVGLTDEDLEAEFGFIDELLRDCCYRTEAKLKEKNT
jgi:hypothetical protein